MEKKQTDPEREARDDAFNRTGGQSARDRSRADDREPPTDEGTAAFDEGERKPSPIESTTDDGVRQPPARTRSRRKRADADAEKHTQATMPPGEGTDPKRNTM